METERLSRYCSTQHEPQAWWEVDLGMLAHITEVCGCFVKEERAS